MKRPYSYTTCCIHSTAEAIAAMVEGARDVTLRTVRQHCDISKWERASGYDTGGQRGGLRLRHDYHVSYSKSRYEGRPCYYICHSAIEYIWIAE
jgi:hypothetical protein